MIDTRLRNTQDQQTLGIPVGPDTSFILAELIGARIDQDLRHEIGRLRGTRYVDDFHLYFDTRAEAETAYDALARIAKKYELEVNERKTEIFEGPDTGEPLWKTALKAQKIRGPDEAQTASFISFVSKAFELAKAFPAEGVLAYAVKKAATTKFNPETSRMYESFLRSALVQDATTMPLVTKLLFDRKTQEVIATEDDIIETLCKLALFHSQRRHCYEVSWLLWLFKVLEAKVPRQVCDAIARMDDPFVALIGFDLKACGLADDLDTSVWTDLLVSESLYSEHWILAYEAVRQGWWRLDHNYVAADPFFGLLLENKFSFYLQPMGSGVDYVTIGY